ncbi:MAG: CRISPR-associated endonuclease Cas2 [Patescibacteria group bacterium]
MGKLEEKSRKRARRKNLQQIILATVASAGVLSVGILAPNILIALDRLGAFKIKRQKEYINSSTNKMVKKGLLKFNGKFYELTEFGKDKLRIWEFGRFKLNKPKRWDRKWRVIIFDIPDKKRKIRDKIRYLFKSAGLYLLQESVWVYPYDCEDIIALLKTDFGVGKDILYLVVEELENDRHLRNEFDLV